jgi:nuclear transport factor 2 (NTF2) superfamily protein
MISPAPIIAPPFTAQTAARKLRAAEDAYEHRIAVRFQYEWHDASGRWWRSYGAKGCRG